MLLRDIFWSILQPMNPNDKKLHRRWFFILLFSPIIAVALGLLIKTSIEKYPIYVVIGFVSFAITFVSVWIITVICGSFWFFYVHRHYYQLWKKMYRNPSLKAFNERFDAERKLLSLNDPKLVKWDNFLKKFWLRAFLIWFILFLLIGLVIWILKKMGIEIPLGG